MSVAAGVAVAELAGLPPGPRLAAALASISLAQLPNGDILSVLRACSRQRAHAEAQFLAAIAEVGRRDPHAAEDTITRLDTPTRYGPDETRAALAWTRRGAYREHEFADTLVHTLPSVHQALRAGHLDRIKAWVFTEHLAELPHHIIDQACARLLPTAGELTPGQLAARLARLIITLDPDRAHHAYERALTQRALVHYLSPDGTAVLAGHHLAPDESAAAHTRIHQLAAAAKHAGSPAPIDHLRTEVYLRLLDGRFHGLTHQQMITQLLHTHPGDTPAADTGTSTDISADTPADALDADTTDPDTTDPDTGGAGGAVPRPHPDRHPTGTRTGVVVRAGLGTILGHYNHPGELPGLGPLLAPLARRLIARQHRARWQWAITDQHGHLLSEGLLRHRPHPNPPPPANTSPPVNPPATPVTPPTHGGTVELHIPLALLLELAAHPPPGWTDVITEITRHHTDYPATAADLATHPERRHPHAALRRHTTIRDRTCTAPGCRQPAHHCDHDHTHPHTTGGPSLPTNLSPLCRHDHQLKHHGHWHLEQPSPGQFTWTSPLGGTYHIRPTRITDPDPPF